MDPHYTAHLLGPYTFPGLEELVRKSTKKFDPDFPPKVDEYDAHGRLINFVTQDDEVYDTQTESRRVSVYFEFVSIFLKIMMNYNGYKSPVSFRLFNNPVNILK